MKLNNKIAEIITEGKCNKSWNTVGVSIDTRNIEHGNLFIALAGSNFNGHDFIEEAFLNGASAAVVNESLLKKEYYKYPLLIVKNTERALVDIAKKAREDFSGIVIAVTGSVGKTTTKEMLKMGLSGVTTVYASKGNFNNNIGMPLSLANLENKYKVAIFELGMSGPHEIEYLSKILKPNIAIITEISSSHSKFFNSLDEIFLAKMEIIKGLIENKILLFNGNNCFFSKAKEMCKSKGITVYNFAEINNINNFNLSTTEYREDFALINSKSNSELINDNMYFKQKIVARINGKIYSYTIPTLAKHKGVLSVLVLGIASILRANIRKVINRFNDYTDMSGRGELIKINIFPNIRVFLIDDSYNASPVSMEKSILMLRNININLRKIIVLGDMLELSNEIAEHEYLKEHILKVKPAAVFTLGKRMQHLINVLPKSIITANYANSADLYQKLISYLNNNDIVLIKGSFNSGVYKVVHKLKSLTS